MKFYRYEEQEVYESPMRIDEHAYRLIKETPCGYWIQRDYGEFNTTWNTSKKWISKTTKKRYAYPTKQEALKSFQARKVRQVEILDFKLSRAKVALGLANSLCNKEKS